MTTPKHFTAAALATILFCLFITGRGFVAAETDTTPDLSTANQTEATEEFRFAVLGDTRGTCIDGQINITTLNRMIERVLSLDPKPVLIFIVGDLSCNGGKDRLREWKEAAAPLYNSSIPVYIIIGNHELHGEGIFKGDTLALQKDFQENFTLPANGPPGYENLAGYIEWGNSFFAILDTYYVDPATSYYYHGKVSRKQINWLKEKASASGKKHKFAFGHTPVYSGRTKDNDQSLLDLWQVMDDLRFDAYFAGHEHYYLRWKIDSSVDPKRKNPVYEVIIGSSGAPLRDKNNDIHPDVFEKKYSLAVIDVKGDKVDVQVYDENKGSSPYDSFSLTP